MHHVLFLNQKDRSYKSIVIMDSKQNTTCAYAKSIRTSFEKIYKVSNFTYIYIK